MEDVNEDLEEEVELLKEELKHSNDEKGRLQQRYKDIWEIGNKYMPAAPPPQPKRLTDAELMLQFANQIRYERTMKSNAIFQAQEDERNKKLGQLQVHHTKNF